MSPNCLAALQAGRALPGAVPILPGVALGARYPVSRGPAPSVVVGEPFRAALEAFDDDDAVLVVHGPVDAEHAAELRDQLRSRTDNGTSSRTVDLARITLLASAGVHVLYAACLRSAANGEHLRLLAPRGSTAHHVLELVGLHPVADV